MRAIVFSDSHGNSNVLEHILSAQPNAELYIHLGDGRKEAELFFEKHPDINSICVSGNCDGYYDDPDTKMVSLGCADILLTHGHRYNVKYDLLALKFEAVQRKANVALFGHTHTPHCEYVDGIYFVNPGKAASLTASQFATIDVTDNEIFCSLSSVRK